MKRALLLLGLGLPCLAHAFAFKVNDASPPHRATWAAGSQVVYALGTERPANIVAGTDVEGSFAQAFAVWEDPSGVRLDVIPGVSGQEVGQDGNNVITFADTAANRDVLGEFHGVTLIWWDANVSMLETDMVYRTDVVSFGDAAQHQDALDLQALASHECGHALGMEHTAIQSATMFPHGGPGQVWRRTLDEDDRLGARVAYGRELAGRGTIQGSVLKDGNPVFEAHVVVEQQGRPVASNVTLHDGTFSISQLLPGTYQVYAEPLDGPVLPASFTGGAWNTGPAAEAFVGARRQADVVVAEGDANTVDLQVVAGTSPNVAFLMPSGDGLSFAGRGPWAISVAPGSSGHVAVMGPGVDGVDAASFFVGQGVSFQALTARGANTDGIPFAILSYAVAADAAPGARTVWVVDGSGRFAALTGALVVPGCKEAGGVDPDSDDVCGTQDNCPQAPNAEQMDQDLDGAGDVCDPCPLDALDSAGCGASTSSSSAPPSSSEEPSSSEQSPSSSGQSPSSSAGGATSGPQQGSSAAASQMGASSTSAAGATSSATSGLDTSSTSTEAGGGGDTPDAQTGCASSRVPDSGLPGGFLLVLAGVWCVRRRGHVSTR